MVNLDFLGKVDVFKGLNEEQLASVQKGCREKEYQSGSRLFGEGEDANDIWMVIEGRVDLRFDLPGGITSEASTVSTESTSMAFGWSSFVPPYKYSLSAYCSSRSCKILRLGREYLMEILEEDPGMGYLVMSNLAGLISTRFNQLLESAMANPYAMVKVIVHMATCGIAAGAREVMTALMDEMSRTDRQDIQIETSGCIGKCPTEPNVTVEIEGEEPVVYQKMNSDKIRQVFKRHVLMGEIQSDFVLV